MDAGEATSGPQDRRQGCVAAGVPRQTNSDLSFVGKYAIQGNYDGPVIWDMSDPSHPALVTAYYVPGVAERRVGLQESHVHVGRGVQRPRRLQAERAVQPRGLGEQGSHARRARVRHQRHQEPEARRQRPDVPRVAHAHGGRRSQGQGQRLHLRLRLGADPVAERASRLRRRHAATRTRNSSLMRIEIIKVPLAHPEQSAVVNRAQHLQRAQSGADARPVGRRQDRRRSTPWTRCARAATGSSP